MPKGHQILLFIILNTALFLPHTTYANSWRMLAPGIEYQELKTNKLTPWSHIHAFRINLAENELKIATANKLSRKYASVDEMAVHNNALLAINGGFFDKKFRPLGLRINNYKQLNNLKRISWWGIFYVKNNRAYISSYRQYHKSPKTSFAMQSGPRLLIDGQTPTLKPGNAERSAIGIDGQGRIIIVVTDNASMSTTDLALMMSKSPINCIDALNLDGGSSSQLYAKIGNFQLNVHGFSDISDAIIVTPK